MPIIRNFKSTNIWNAFILNSIATTLVIFLAMTVKERLDTYSYDDDDRDNKIERKTNVTSVIITLLATFLTSMFAYTIMHYMFDYGGGMLINE